MRDNTHAPMEMKHITPDVLMRLSIAFTSGSKFSQSLEKALELIGKISNHDRIYIIEVHHNMTYTITYNWHEKSLKAIPEEFRHNSLITLVGGDRDWRPLELWRVSSYFF